MTAKFALALMLTVIGGSAFAADGKGLPSYMYSPLPMITGDLEVGIGVFQPGETIGMFTTTGRASAPIQGSMNFEVQATGTAMFQGGGGEGWTDAYAHAWWRNPTMAWGVFGGAEFIGTVVGAIGAEFKHYAGNMSFGGEAAYLWASGGDAWEIAGSGNFYLNANHRVGVYAQYVTGFGAPNMWNVKADVEARFAGSPWSVWGSIGYMNASGSTAWTGLVGFHMFLDAMPQSTLASHEMEVPFRFQSLLPVAP